MADVLLIEVGPRTIEVIRAVRKITGCGLVEAKRLVESAPAVVAYGVHPDAAERALGELQRAGAWPELRDSDFAPVPAGDGTVQLLDAGRNKITVIKVVREHLGLGLREAKDLVESAPAVVASGLDDYAAAALREALERAGASVG